MLLRMALFFLNYPVRISQKSCRATAALLKKGRVKVSDLFSEKKGVTYDAVVVIADTGKYVNYKLEFEKNPENRKSTQPSK